MGGAIYFQDANGNTVQAGEEHPLPTTGSGSETTAAATDEE